MATQDRNIFVVPIPRTERGQKVMEILQTLSPEDIRVDKENFLVLILDPGSQYRGNTGFGTFYHLVIGSIRVTTRLEVVKAYLETDKI